MGATLVDSNMPSNGCANSQFGKRNFRRIEWYLGIFHLKENKSIQAAVSDRTLKLTEKMVKVFIIQVVNIFLLAIEIFFQLCGAMIFMIIPLTAIFSSLMIDLHESMTGKAMTVIRVIINVCIV